MSESKLFDTLTAFLKEYFKKVNFENKLADDNKKNYPACKELIFAGFTQA